MLFEHLLEPGDRVRRRAADLRPHAADAAAPRRRAGAGAARGRRPRRRRPRGGARRGAAEARPRDPQLPQPGRLHALGSEKRVRLVELAAEHGFWIFEDDPYRRAALRGRGAGDDALDRQGGPRGPRLLLLEDGQPRGPGRLPRRARRGDRGARQARQRDLHLAQHAGRGGRAGALPLGRPRHATSSSSRAPCASAATRWSRRCASRSPRPSSSSPAAATSSGSTSTRAPTPPRCWPRPRARASPSSPAPTS